MKIIKTIVLSILTLFTVSCSQETATQKELIEIKQLLIEINQKLGEGKNNNTGAQRDSLASINQASLDFKRQGANFEELDKISLPENPSKDQVKEYIRKICVASAKQNTYSDSDPQVFMLSKIGNNNLELLLNTNLNHQGDFYIVPTVIQLVEEKDKELIIKHLPYKKDLVKVITQKGWEKDAKTILYNELRQIPHYLPTEWIKAIANLQESCIYEDLKQYLILGSNKKWTYEAIKLLPGIELDDTVIKAWENAKREQWSRSSFAPIALAHGQADALAVIVDSLDSSPNDHNSVRHPRKHILQYTYATGSNNEIRSWYDENKNKLFFDTENRKYIVNK